MTHKEQSDADTSGQLGPKRRVWGGSPTSRFSQAGRKAGLVKIASVATEALLASSFKSLWQRICLQLPH